MRLPLDNYPRLAAFRRRYLPRQYLLNTRDHVCDIIYIIYIVNTAIHPTIWTHQEIGGDAPDLVQLSYRRLRATRGVDVDASQTVLFHCLVPLIGGVQRDV